MNQQAQLLAAIRTRDPVKVQELLTQDPSLARIPTPDGSVLLTAVYHGAREVVPLIRAHRPQLNIFEAAALGEMESLRSILDTNPDQANALSADGLTPLGMAAFMGHREAVGLLLDRGAAIDAISQSTKPHIPRNTALHAALVAHRWEVAELLLDRGAGIHLRDSNGMTPLHVAAARGGTAMVQRLLQAGAEVNPRDNKGRTPLALAVESDHEEVAELLRGHGGAT